MTDMQVGSITQLTETGRITWYERPQEHVVTFEVQPDPRDARIAELEAVLSSIRGEVERWQVSRHANVAMFAIAEIIDRAAMTEPEASLQVAVEELDA